MKSIPLFILLFIGNSFAYSSDNTCNDVLSSPSSSIFSSFGRSVVSQVSNAASSAAASATATSAKFVSALNQLNTIITETNALSYISSMGVDAADYTALYTKEIAVRVPSAGMRVVQFELTPTIFIEDILIPVLALIKEYESESYSESSLRQAKVQATLVVRATETGLKCLKIGAFGILPDPFILVYDLGRLNSEIVNSQNKEESLMREMMTVIYAHIQKEIINPDEEKTFNERMQSIATLKPVLLQMNEMLARRVSGFQQLSTAENIDVYLSSSIDEFIFNEFGLKEVPGTEEDSDPDENSENSEKGWLNSVTGFFN